jgi:ATP-dependent helicase HrpB
MSLKEPLGERVGYSVRHEHKRSSRTLIEAMTDGLFLRRLQNDPELTGINCVIFDEFHERSRNSELALALVREAQEVLRPDLCLLLMSATLDLTNLRAQLPHAQVLTSEGKAFPVETQHLSPRPNEPLEGRVLRAIEQELPPLLTPLAAGDHPSTVLVFLPGLREIERCRQRLLKATLLNRWEIIALHGRQSLTEQGRALKPCNSEHDGRVVLATSIAESSLTLDGVRLVIDCGLTRHTQFDPGTGMEGLITVPASQASADQRRGRAGRQNAGRCIRLWSPAEQQRRPAHDIPELQRADPQPTVLDLALWGAGLGESLPWLEPPPRAALQEGRRQLLELGALNAEGRPTNTGQKLARFGAHPRLGILLLQAHALGRAQLGADLAAILNERDLLSQHHHGSDLWARMLVLRNNRSSSQRTRDRAAADRLRTVSDQSRRWVQQLEQFEQEQKPQGIEATDEQIAAQLVATAFPEWIAVARPGQRGQFLLRQGRGAALQVSDPLDGAEALAIAQLDLGDTKAKIRLALPLTHQWVKELADQNGHWQERVLWDEQTKRVKAERVLQLGALELDRQALQQPACEQSRDVLIKQERPFCTSLEQAHRATSQSSCSGAPTVRSPVASTHSPTPGKASQHLDWRHFDGLQKLGRHQGRAADGSSLG